jgi:hypothetical protein
VSFLPQYGTAYVLYDEHDTSYRYAIKSDTYGYSPHEGLQAEVSGPVSEVSKELAVMNVTHIHPIVRSLMREGGVPERNRRS